MKRFALLLASLSFASVCAFAQPTPPPPGEAPPPPPPGEAPPPPPPHPPMPAKAKHMKKKVKKTTTETHTEEVPPATE